MATRRLSGMTTSSSVPDNGGDHSGGGGSGTYVDDVFSTYLYVGNGFYPSGGGQTITNGIDLDGEGGMIWIKARNTDTSHAIYDTERTINKLIGSDLTTGEHTDSAMVSANSDGFTLGDESTGWGRANMNGNDYVSWTFRKAPSFLDVVTWTGDSVAGREIPHNLGVEPGMVIVKNTTSSNTSWAVYHASAWPASGFLQENNAFADSVSTGWFNNTEPTDSVFTVGDVPDVNKAGEEYVAYFFAHDDSDEGLIQCGSFSPSPSGFTDVDLGWEPQWILTKATVSSGVWRIMDNMRGVTEDDASMLYPNSANAEDQGETASRVKFTATGFAHNCNFEGIYMAIRRPNKPAKEFEADELFWIDVSSGSDTPNFQTRAQNFGDPAFPIDFALNRSSIASTSDTHVATRMLGEKEVWTNRHSVEGFQRNHTFDFMDGFADQNLNLWYAWMWRRAPGFFDVVAYGGPVSNYISHNLTVPPEMIWTKERSGNTYWDVWHKDLLGAATINGYSPSLVLNTDAAVSAAQGYSDTPPTENQYYLSSIGGALNEPNKTYVAYLFASVPGISKVGSYTGNGGTIEVDCGFTNGARWVLAKRTDGVGDWWMTAVEGALHVNMIALNKADAQLGGSGFASSHPPGFKIINSNGGLNTVGAEYIYMAIA